MSRLDVVAFDGDDTLWFSESVYSLTHERFRQLMQRHAPPEHLDERLHQTEMANLRRYGYGVKAFTLSMIETAIAVSEGTITAPEIGELLALGRDMLDHPVDLLPGAAGAVEAAAGTGARVLLITKGDLFHQESKLARSGLGDLFTEVEIVSDKNVPTLRRLFARYSVDPHRFVMIGDSLRSDIAPALEVGGWAVHVPHEFVWAHERDTDLDAIERHPRLRRIETLESLPALLPTLA